MFRLGSARLLLSHPCANIILNAQLYLLYFFISTNTAESKLNTKYRHPLMPGGCCAPGQEDVLNFYILENIYSKFKVSAFFFFPVPEGQRDCCRAFSKFVLPTQDSMVPSPWQQSTSGSQTGQQVSLFWVKLPGSKTGFSSLTSIHKTPKSCNLLTLRVAEDLGLNTEHMLILYYGTMLRTGTGNVQNRKH